MKFGEVPLEEAIGAVLAHSSGTLKKGRLLSAADIDALRASGRDRVIVARLGSTDVGEDEAAARIGSGLAGSGCRSAEAFTGRTNIYATAAGIVVFNPHAMAALNQIDEAVTVATLRPYERVHPGQLIATVKIIPFAVAADVADAASRQTDAARIDIAPFTTKPAGLILTRLPGTKDSVLAKRERAVADRIAGCGSSLAARRVVAHRQADVKAAIIDLAAAGCDPVLVFAASAIVDRADVIPAALVDAGGEVLHLGMPVDPGNLLMLGKLGAADVIGVPSCAGSPKLNGFDWVLERRLAGLPVGPGDIAAMGVGGLLKEIASRPQPRDAKAPAEASRREPRLAAVVMAAGRSTRMGANNKLTESVNGKPMVRQVVEAALSSSCTNVLVVTGHQAERVRSALEGLQYTPIHNPEFASGLATSLKAGLAALGTDVDGAVVLLGDMPRIEAGHIDRLIAAFSPEDGRSVVVPVHFGKRGNPVLWGRQHFAEMMQVSGDTGARHLIGELADSVAEVDLGTDAIFLDIDTPAALQAIRERG